MNVARKSIHVLVRWTAALLLTGIAGGLAQAADSVRAASGTGHDARRDLGKIADRAPHGEPTYVVTGAHAAFATPGVSLLRAVSDNATSGGTILHSAGAGPGTTVDTWSTAYALPFPVKLYGQSYESFSVSKSGLLTFSTWAAGQEVRNAEPPEPPTDMSVAVSSVPAQTTHPAQTIAMDSGSETAAAAQFDEIVSGGGGGGGGETLPLAYLPPATIAFFYDPVLLPGTHTVRGFLHGNAPNRQLWIVNAGQRKRAHGRTYTALVLEETTHRIMMADMWAESEPATGTTVVGVQRNADVAHDVPASPRVPVTGVSSAATDNAFYLFQPDTIGSQVNGEGHPSLDAIDDYVANALNAKGAPGATVAVSYNGRLIFSKGFGWADVEQKIPMQDWHRAQMGSVTKMLTAVGAFRLLELDGLGSVFELDMPLYGAGGVLPDLSFEQALWNGISKGLEDGLYTDESLWWGAYHDITVRNLLTHTSGFARSGDSDGTTAALGVDYADLSYEDVHLHFLANQPLLSLPAQLAMDDSAGGIDSFDSLQPQGAPDELAEKTGSTGARRAYSNHGFGLLGHIIARTSGMPYHSFVREYVLDPVGLEAIDLPPVYWQDKTELDAKRYFYYSEGSPYVTSLFDGSRIYGAYGYKPIIDNQGATGSWVASARDLVRFMCALDGLGNQPDVLAPATLAEMESVPFPDAVGGASQPHGWDSVSASGTFGKNGRMGFGAAQIYKWPNGISVAIVVNTGAPGSLGTTAVGVYNRVEDVIGSIPYTYDLFDTGPQIALKP